MYTRKLTFEQVCADHPGVRAYFDHVRASGGIQRSALGWRPREERAVLRGRGDRPEWRPHPGAKNMVVPTVEGWRLLRARDASTDKGKFDAILTGSQRTALLDAMAEQARRDVADRDYMRRYGY